MHLLATQAATAGFVVGRLLLEPPAAALVENLGKPDMRSTWPLSDAHSTLGLTTLSCGIGDLSAVRFDYERLFLRPPVIDMSTAGEAASDLIALYQREGLSAGTFGRGYQDHLGLQILYLAERAAAAAQSELAGNWEQAARQREAAAHFRQAFMNEDIERILGAMAQRAATSLFQALPHLIRGFLAEEQRSRTLAQARR